MTFIQRLAIPGSGWKAPDGTMIDILERSDDWVGAALINPTFDPQGSPVLALPYLTLMELESSRTPGDTTA